MTDTELKLLTSCLILVAALGSALWNVRVKASTNNLLFVTLMVIPQFFVAAILALFAPLPSLQSFQILSLSSIVQTFYIIFLVNAYRHAALSRVYPMAIGSATLLALFWHLLIGQQEFSLFEYLGILILSSAMIGFTFFGKENNKPINRKSIAFAIGTSLFIFMYSTIDTYGIRTANNALSYISWLFVIKALLLFFPMLLLGKINWHEVLNKKYYIRAGLLAGIGYAVAVFAFIYSPTSIVLALRSTSILFIFILSRYMLNEKMLARGYIFTFATFVGVFLILISQA